MGSLSPRPDPIPGCICCLWRGSWELWSCGRLPRGSPRPAAAAAPCCWVGPLGTPVSDFRSRICSFFLAALIAFFACDLLCGTSDWVGAVALAGAGVGARAAMGEVDTPGLAAGMEESAEEGGVMEGEGTVKVFLGLESGRRVVATMISSSGRRGEGVGMEPLSWKV